MNGRPLAAAGEQLKVMIHCVQPAAAKVLVKSKRKASDLPNNGQNREGREAIFAIEPSLRVWYFAVFFGIIAAIAAAVSWQEISAGNCGEWSALPGCAEAALDRTSAIVAARFLAIAAATVFIVDMGEFIMGLILPTRKTRAQKIMEEGREKGREEGMEKGREEGVQMYARMAAWNERRLEAERKGEPFTEPFPKPDAQP